MVKENKFLTIMKNPITILSSLLLGLYLGINYPALSKYGDFIGFLFIKLLKLLVLPVLVTFIISSIGKLTRLSKIKKVFIRSITAFLIALILSSFIGLGAGIIAEPGANLTEENMRALGDILKESHLENVNSEYISPIISLFKNTNNTLNNDKVLFFVVISIFFGVSIGIINHKKGDSLIGIFDALSSSFEKIISWVLGFLPLGIIALMVSQVKNFINLPSLPFFKLTLTFYFIAAILLLAGTIIIWQRSGQKLIIVLKALLKPVLVSLTTGSSLATIPIAVNAMKVDLKFDGDSTNFFIPLGQTIGRFGNIVFFSLAGIFSLQLYSYDITFSSLIILFATSIVAGISTAGTSSFLTMIVLSKVLKPLNLPVEALIILFTSIDLIINPVRSFLIIFINLIAASIVSKPNSAIVDNNEYGILLQNFPDDINLKKYFSNFDGEVTILNSDKCTFLDSVFPKVKFKKIKKWETIEPLWLSYDINIVIGERQKIKGISQKLSGDFRFIALNQHH